MSELFKTPGDDAFFSHPAADSFVKASRSSLAEHGDSKIKSEILDELRWAFAIPDGELSALKYLAEKRVDDTSEGIYG